MKRQKGKTKSNFWTVIITLSSVSAIYNDPIYIGVSDHRGSQTTIANGSVINALINNGPATFWCQTSSWFSCSWFLSKAPVCNDRGYISNPSQITCKRQQNQCLLTVASLDQLDHVGAWKCYLCKNLHTILINP